MNQEPSRFWYRVWLFLLVLLAGGNWLAWSAATSLGETRIVFLNVGQGDAIFVESATGRQLLVDGGPGPALLRELGEIMPFYDRALDLVLLTHPDADHLGGLPALLERYRVDTVLQTDARADTGPAREWFARAAERRLQILPARRGLLVWLAPDLVLRLLLPDRPVATMEANAGSAVAELIYQRSHDSPIRILLTGDAPAAMERYLLTLEDGNLRADVLKAGHHGSKTSTAPELVAALAPDYAVISAGAKNRYGHPHPEVIATLEKAGVEILETKNGRVEFRLGPTGLRLVD